MLKCRIDKNKGTVKVHAKGTAQDLNTETLALVKEVYQGIKQKNDEAARAYRVSLIGALLDPTSLVWGEEEV